MTKIRVTKPIVSINRIGGENMKTIYDVLREDGTRLMNGHRWLIINQPAPYHTTFVVYEHQHGKHNSTILIETDDEELAVTTLMED